MADLRTCYFCGTGPGGSLDSYGVVPSTLDPTPDDQRSVVLCPDCRNKLTALLRPVVDAAESSPAPESGGLSPADDEVTGLAESTAGAVGSGTPERDEQPDSSSGTDRPADADQPAGDPDPAAGERAGTEPAGGEPAAAEPAAAEPSGAEPTNAGEPSEQSVTFDESSESEGGLAGSSGEDEEAPSKPRDPSAEALMGDDSEAYRKVIRLLQNRDFPVRRVEIEELATNAYELGPGECSDAIDAIIQKGLLVEEEGTLRRTSD